MTTAVRLPAAPRLTAVPWRGTVLTQISDSVAAALVALRAGRPVIVRDAGSEGDVLFAAEHASPQLISEMVRHTGGYVCAAMSQERADQLQLPAQYRTNAPAGLPRYCVSVDAAEGIGTGISATDRATTLRLLAATDTKVDQLSRPGHIVTVAVDVMRLGSQRGAESRLSAGVLLVQAAQLQPVAASATLLTARDRLLGAGPNEPLRADVPTVHVAELIECRRLRLAGADASQVRVPSLDQLG